MQEWDAVLARVEFREALERGDRETALSLLASLAPADKAALYEGLDLETQAALMPSLPVPDAAGILEELEDPTAAQLAVRLEPDVLARVLDEMEPDKAADLLGDLEPPLQALTLGQMSRRAAVRPLLGYPDDSAGGLMTSSYYAFPIQMPATEVLRRIRRRPAGGEEIPYVYAVDGNGVLAGVTRLADLIRAHPEQPLGLICREQVISVRGSEDREAVARLANHYDLIAIPVVDALNRLVGVITADDALTVQTQEAREDSFRSAGILGGEAARSDLLVRGPLWRIWLVRVPFLVLTLLGGMLAGRVIHAYEEALETVVVLALFLPAVMGMGGNAGVQSSAAFIRGHVLGQVDTDRFRRHLLREVGVGLGMGAVFGVVAGGIAALWQGIPALGLVVGLSLLCAITVATALGFAIPYLLIRLGLDPAAGSDPLVTSLNDITGLLIYFLLASRLMGSML